MRGTKPRELSKEDIPDETPATIDLGAGWSATVRVEPDEGMGPPWEEHDGHGEVSEWTTRDKAPGEMVLCEDRKSRRYYDFAGTVEKARREEWGGPGNTKGEQAHNAALEDFKRLRGWCRDEWCWIIVSVTVRKPDGWRQSDCIAGVESDGDYWKGLACEMINGLLPTKGKKS